MNCANIMWMIFLQFDCILSQTHRNTGAYRQSPYSGDAIASFECGRVDTAHTHTYTHAEQSRARGSVCARFCDRSCHGARKLFNNLSQTLWVCRVRDDDDDIFCGPSCEVRVCLWFNTFAPQQRHTIEYNRNGTKLFLTDHVTFAMATSANMFLFFFC